VTLTHLGSISVAEGAAVGEGDVVATVGPSGTPEQSVPYVHLGIRLAADPLGYLDPLAFLPAPATPAPTPTPTPVPAPQPVAKPVHVPAHPHGGGLVIERAPAKPQPVPVSAPAEPVRASKPEARPEPKAEPRTKPQPAKPAAETWRRTDAPQIRRPMVEPVARAVLTAPEEVAHAIEAEPLVLSAGPGIIAALLALTTAFMRSRRQTRLPAKVIAFRKELPLRRAA
jgi:pyruvate/2-oxoglutarate dehydrogenase complex dihydrolipoamide acyltransferase (E2) component